MARSSTAAKRRVRLRAGAFKSKKDLTAILRYLTACRFANREAVAEGQGATSAAAQTVLLDAVYLCTLSPSRPYDLLSLAWTSL